MFYNKYNNNNMYYNFKIKLKLKLKIYILNGIDFFNKNHLLKFIKVNYLYNKNYYYKFFNVISKFLIIVIIIYVIKPINGHNTNNIDNINNNNNFINQNNDNINTNTNVKYSTNTVKTKYGLLRGIVLRNKPLVEAYLGVPYATPPLGNLRYMPPVTPSTWRNIRLADRFSPVCPQAPPIPATGPEALLEVPRERLAQLRRLLPLLTNQSEDCLYMNLYVPRNQNGNVDSSSNRASNIDLSSQNNENSKFSDGSSNDKSKNRIATIVYIHGESYEWNSGNPYDGSVLAAYGNVIVVTINFRLGILGFLKTGPKENAQGNFGLMDLIAGLHWLRENLPAFNGDPNKITLMGHGTGAALANILIVSPVASDLANRAILLSGSALSPWAIQTDPIFIKRRVAEHTGCHGDLLSDDIAPCLRSKSIAELISIQMDTPRFLVGFAPFVDGTVIVGSGKSNARILTLPTGSAIASTTGIEFADFPSRELLFGLTSLESYLDLSAQDLEFGFNETRRDRIIRTYVRNIYHLHLNEIYSALKNEYTDWERSPRNPMGARDATLELLSDGHTVAPLIKLGHLHSLRGGRSYFLHFRHQSGDRDFPLRSGSVRGEDVPFCLGLPLSSLFPYNYTTQDVKVSRILIRYLSNFAENGNPNEFKSSPVSLSIVSNTYSLSSSDISSLNSNNNYNNINNVNNNNDKGTNNNYNQNTNNIIEKHNVKREIDNILPINERITRNSHFNDGHDNEDHDSDEDSNESVRPFSQEDNNNESKNVQKSNVNYEEFDSNGYYVPKPSDMPFWDAYDSINQLYLELGTKTEIKSHYRGHKLSMWLSLIPQLHTQTDSAEMSMKHHHFVEESAIHYDGIVRPQSMLRPPPIKLVTVGTTSTTLIRTDGTVPTVSTTECPPNTTIIPTLAATRPQQNQQQPISNINTNNNNNFLKRLANTHYQSYTTALTVTIAVGCFLLLLNILIFVGIYYQREKRASDAKRKEELTENESSHHSIASNLDKCDKSSRKSSIESLVEFNTSGGSFVEYDCYDEKQAIKEKRALADICNVELPRKTCSHSPARSSSPTDSLMKETYKNTMCNRTQDGVIPFPPTYSTSITTSTSPPIMTAHHHHHHVHNMTTQTPPESSTPHHHHVHHSHPNHSISHQHSQTPSTSTQYLNASFNTGPPEVCNQATQSESIMLHDADTTTNDNDINGNNDDGDDDENDSNYGNENYIKCIPEPPPPPKIHIIPSQPQQQQQLQQSSSSGILRGGPSTPGTAKKRVQIQEISV